MIKTVQFPPSNRCGYTGRNGQGYQVGLDVMTSTRGSEALVLGRFPVVQLTPINTKGLAHCDLEIPLASLDEFIVVLQEARDEMRASASIPVEEDKAA